MVVWIIGLSGSGKSTLGRELAEQWRSIAANTVLLDGDEIRALFRHDRGSEPYTVEGRRVNAERIVRLCEFLDVQGINVVCCILSIFQDMRTQNRRLFSSYYEVFLDAPLEVLIRRDVKDLYAPAQRGEVRNVVGIDIPFERPVGADFVIDSSIGNINVEELARKILARAMEQ